MEKYFWIALIGVAAWFFLTCIEVKPKARATAMFLYLLGIIVAQLIGALNVWLDS